MNAPTKATLVFLVNWRHLVLYITTCIPFILRSNLWSFFRFVLSYVYSAELKFQPPLLDSPRYLQPADDFWVANIVSYSWTMFSRCVLLTNSVRRPAERKVKNNFSTKYKREWNCLTKLHTVLKLAMIGDYSIKPRTFRNVSNIKAWGFLQALFLIYSKF